MKLSLMVAAFLLVGGCTDGDIIHSSPVFEQREETGSPSSALPVLQLEDYTDPVAGYEAQIPKGWRRVVQDSKDDSGYTVTFESPPSSIHDAFSDYLMVEVLPGQVPDGFPFEPDERTVMDVAGRKVYRERFRLDNYPIEDTHLDLVAWQLKLVQADYSVGVYLVGEQPYDARLERILIEFAYSFKLAVSPFTVSAVVKQLDLSG